MSDMINTNRVVRDLQAEKFTNHALDKKLLATNIDVVSLEDMKQYV